MPITKNHGHGLIRRPFAATDKHLLGAMAVIGNFSVSSGIKPAPIKDQGSSESCTAQAFGYYFYNWTGIDLSREDLYSRYYLPGGGGYLTSPFEVMNSLGNYDLTQHADPAPETEANMEVVVDVPGQGRRRYNCHFWILQDQSIDGVAWAIDQYKGALGGVTGSNEGWIDPINPRPPASGEAQWSHALWFYDHNMINGLKNVVAESSWAAECLYHNIKENYFISGDTFDFIAMEVTGDNIMPDRRTVNYKGKLGWVDFSGTFPDGIFATTPAMAQDFQKNLGLPIIVNADGSFNPTEINIAA